MAILVDLEDLGAQRCIYEYWALLVVPSCGREESKPATGLNTFHFNKILLCICDGMNIAFNGFYNFVFSIVSSLSDF